MLAIIVLVGVVVGVGCVAWTVKSARHRKQSQPVESKDPDLDQTCELNYRPE